MNCSGAGSDARRGDDDRVLHRAVLRELVHHLRNGRLLLADRVDVDAEDVGVLLIDDRVDRDGGLARLAVADDQLALAAADRDHRIDGLDARLQRLVDRLSGHDARRLDVSTRRRSWSRSGPLPSIGLPSASTTRPEQFLADRHFDDAPVRRDQVAFLDRIVRVAHDRDADVVLFEVQHHAGQAAGNSTSSHRPARCRDRRHARCRRRRDSTVPVSATSISRSYSLISRFRMSVISAGLISIRLVVL